MKYKKAEEMTEATKRAEFHAIYLTILDRSQMGQYDHTMAGELTISSIVRFKDLGYKVNYEADSRETTISWPKPAPF